MKDERAAFGLQFGHGLGVGLYESPMISRLHSFDAPVELEVGMVFALETYCPATDGRSAARIEEEVDRHAHRPAASSRASRPRSCSSTGTHLRPRRGSDRRARRLRRRVTEPVTQSSARAVSEAELYRRMLLIRGFEELVQTLFLRGEVYGTTHLYSGQEAVAVGFASALHDGDRVACTYRGHGHTLALGRRPGGAARRVPRPLDRHQRRPCRLDERRRPGSRADRLLRHRRRLASPPRPAPRSRSRAAARSRSRTSATAPRTRRTSSSASTSRRCSTCRSCSSARTTATASTRRWRRSPAARSSPAPSRSACRRARSTGWTSAPCARPRSPLTERVRAGSGPEFVEALTYRFVGHSRSDPGKYRPRGELERWQERDPLIVAAARLRATSPRRRRARRRSPTTCEAELERIEAGGARRAVPRAARVPEFKAAVA